MIAPFECVYVFEQEIRKMVRRLLFCTILFGIGVIAGTGIYQAYDANTKVPGVLIKRSTIAPWIEVYHDGELTSEWQPKDWEIYRFLANLLEDDLYVPVPVEPLEENTMLAVVF